MIGLDTNVLVRYITQDDEIQARLASEAIEGLTESDTGFVSVVVLVETYWVLCRAYQTDKKDVAKVLSGLLAAKEIVIEQASAVGQALRKVREGADFADALIALSGASAGSEYTLTFDKNAAKYADMRLLK